MKHKIREEDECSICFYSLKKKTTAVTECGHVYHLGCIRKWFNLCDKKLCPLCNASTNIEQVNAKYCCYYFLI